MHCVPEIESVKPSAQVQLQPEPDTIFELSGITGQLMHEKLYLLKPFLHTKSHAYGPAINPPGFIHAMEFGRSWVGHDLHTGAEVPPQLVISKN